MSDEKKDEFFQPIGDAVPGGETTEAEDNGITQIPNSLCMACGETGTTNMILTRYAALYWLFRVGN